MELSERIKKLGNYFKNMNVVSESGLIYVLIEFPSGWGCSELTEYNFNVKVAREDVGLYYFFAEIGIGFDAIFDAIEYNISFNEEAQAKVNLLRSMIDKLKGIFEEEDIETLKTLEFKYKKKKSRGNKDVKSVKTNNNISVVENNEDIREEEVLETVEENKKDIKEEVLETVGETDIEITEENIDNDV